jgi:hypothetical protein
MAYTLLSVLFCVAFAMGATMESLLDQAGGNVTILNTEAAPGWADSPQFRGTSDILWSCIVTITACVYTAMHLNIPREHRSKWARLGAKVKWATIAILGPELVLLTAFKQFRAARDLCTSLKNIQGQSKAVGEHNLEAEVGVASNLQSSGDD